MLRRAHFDYDGIQLSHQKYFMFLCSITDMLRYFTVRFATSGHITIH